MGCFHRLHLQKPAETGPSARFRRLHLSGYGEDDAHLRQLHTKRRTPVAEEGQGDAGGGEKARHHADIQKGLHGHQGDDAHYQQAAETVPGVEGDPVAPEDQQSE